MIVLIIAGGSGTRLWPLSTPSKPKHLLCLNNDKKSLLQNTYKRAKLLSKDIYVVTEESHDHLVVNQLPKIDQSHIIVEPSRRGTANCIVLALSQLEKKGLDPDEPIAIMAADHYIDDNQKMKKAFQIASQYSKKLSSIVLIGIKPNYPATGFGYIKLGNSLQSSKDEIYHVDSFKEKPKLNIAKKFYESKKYLWNGGYFIGSINTFKQEIQKVNKSLYNTYQYLLNNKVSKKFYNNLKSDSIDYALIEKLKNLYVIPANFQWLDLGSFKDLSNLSINDKNNNYINGKVIVEEVKNSYICNKEKKPLVIIGLDDLVVINNENGILVIKKSDCQKIGEVSKKITTS